MTDEPLTLINSVRPDYTEERRRRLGDQILC